METRPQSATKRWRVAEILEKAKYRQIRLAPMPGENIRS